ncbi:MAG: T9SS type A sorting domain-containing protein [Candidatus Krumholzibacteria bacterium]|nr:T9SS type A sorting domain-containing protein [Candidatus Krumholzibacteria bacterium]
MEPAINSGLSSDVDLTLAHFHDLGWTNTCDLPVSVAIAAFNVRPTSSGVEIRARFSSTLGSANYVAVYRADSGRDVFAELAIVDAPRNGDFLYVDNTALAGKTYVYRIGVIDGDGEFLSPTAEVRLPGASIELAQNSPNPFNPTTSIRFTLPARERVGLAIYSASGALVRMLVDDVRDRGAHDITWDGRDSSGTPVGSGVYFYRLTAGKFNESKKMVLLK